MTTQDKLTVTARFRARPDKIEQTRAAITALIAPTRIEAGCINYDLHQSTEDPCQFLLYENWISKKDLDEHLAMPYLASFLSTADELLAEPVEILLWRMIS